MIKIKLLFELNIPENCKMFSFLFRRLLIFEFELKIEFLVNILIMHEKKKPIHQMHH